MKNKKFVSLVIILCILSLLVTYGFYSVLTLQDKKLQTTSALVTPLQTSISATGSIRSQNEAALNFQTGGKLIYLPFKEGDKILQGQTIAQLDTYILQRQLTQALNAYRTTRDTFDQVKDNAGNSILQGQQKYQVNAQNANPVNGDLQNTVVNDIAKRILDQNQASLDNSVINVEITNNALSLATLTAPISGVIMHEDVSVPNVAVTPLTTFSIADPSTPVFRANVSESDIDYLTEGTSGKITLNGVTGKTFQGTVIKIYPQKTTLADGRQVYQVDIASDDLKTVGKLQQSGTVLLDTATMQGGFIIPSWLILAHNAVWVLDGNNPVLKHIVLGKTHGNYTEVLSGISKNDKIITNPQFIAAEKYSIL